MIRRLSEDVRGQLRTGVALTSVAQCVEELLLNSVDAGATCVAVRVDLQAMTITVVDNGHGITKDQLPLLGERYSTSKCHSVDDLDNLQYFGYRGEALASIISASSFVEILTRSQGEIATYSKRFHKGHPLSVTEPSQPRPGVGTTVTVRNLFYNLPVRRKKLNEGVELERTRYRVAGLALMWPLISFSLRDEVTGNVILQTHKCSGVLGTFTSLFGLARAKHMREVGVSSQDFTITGYVSRENYSRNDLQFVFVNHRLVLKSKLHKVVNTVLAKSVLVRRRGVNTAWEKSRQEQGSSENGSPTKLFERYAVFVINIQCSVKIYDITFDPTKTLVEFNDWGELTALVEAMLMEFLREENLLPAEDNQGIGQVMDSQVTEMSPSDTLPSELAETDDPFDGNNDCVDEEFHDALQRSMYAQGISLHTTIHSLSSHTVRRPAPSLKEEMDELCPSSPKKSRQSNSCGCESKQMHNQEGCSKSDPSTSAANSRRTSEAGYRDGSAGASDDDDEDTCVLTQFHTPVSRHSSRDVLTISDSAHPDASESKPSKITLPKAAGPSERGMLWSSQRNTASAKPQDEASCSEPTVKKICLPQELSLSHVRARVARQYQHSFSSPPHLAAKPHFTKSTAAVLQKFQRTAQQHRKKGRDAEDKRGKEDKLDMRRGRGKQLDLRGYEEKLSTRRMEDKLVMRGMEEEADNEEELSARTRIVMPCISRPRLSRSRSLDSRGCFCGAPDSPSIHCASPVPTHCNTATSMDDIHVSYSSPYTVLHRRKRASGDSCVEQCTASPESELHLSDTKVRQLITIPLQYKYSVVSCQRMNDHRKENDVCGVQNIANRKYSEVTDNPSDTHLPSIDEAPHTSLRSGEEEAQLPIDSLCQHLQCERKRDSCSAVSRRAVTCTVQQQETSSGSPVSRAVVFNKHRPGQSHMSHVRPHKFWSQTSTTGLPRHQEFHRHLSGQSHRSYQARPEKLWSEAAQTDDVCRSLDPHRQMSGQLSYMTCFRPALQGTVHSANIPTSASHPLTRPGLGCGYSKQGRVSQASKLARLMRTVQAPDCEGSTARLEQRDRRENLITQQAHCSSENHTVHKGPCGHSDQSGRFVRSSKASSANHSSIQKVQKGQYLVKLAHTDKPYYNLTALEMLNRCQPSQNSSQPRNIHTLAERKDLSSSSGFPELHLFETPNSVFKRSVHSSDVGDLGAQKSIKRRQQLETAATLNLFQTSHSLLCARDLPGGHALGTENHGSARHTWNTASHRRAGMANHRHIDLGSHRQADNIVGHSRLDITSHKPTDDREIHLEEIAEERASHGHTDELDRHLEDFSNHRHVEEIASYRHTDDIDNYKHTKNTAIGWASRPKISERIHSRDDAVQRNACRHPTPDRPASYSEQSAVASVEPSAYSGRNTVSARHNCLSSNPPGVEWIAGDGTVVERTGQINPRLERRNYELSPSGDAPQAAESLGSLGGRMTSPCTGVLSEAPERVEECRIRHVGCPQQTQAFSAIFSQGFYPLLTEEGSLPFDVSTIKASTSQGKIQAQTDSPLSTHSAGFSPTAADPLLVNQSRLNSASLPGTIEPEGSSADSMASQSHRGTSHTLAKTGNDGYTQNTAAPYSIPEISEMPPSSVNAALCTDSRVSQSQAPGETETDIDSSLSHGRCRQRSDSSSQLFFSGQREVQGPEAGERNMDPELCGDADTDGLTGSSLQQLRLSQIGWDSQAFPCYQRPKVSCIDSSSPTSSTSQPSILIPCSDDLVASLSVHEASSVDRNSDSQNNLQALCTASICCVPETECSDSQLSVTGQVSPLPKAACISESPLITHTKNSQEEIQGQKAASDVRQSDVDEEYFQNLLKDTVQKHPETTVKGLSCSSGKASEHSSEKQSLTATCSTKARLSNNYIRDSSGKPDIDGVHDFPCLNEKRARTVNQSELSASPSARDCVVRVPSRSHRAQSVDESEKTMATDLSHRATSASGDCIANTLSNGQQQQYGDQSVSAITLPDTSNRAAERKMPSSQCQQTDSFSSSLPDSALASVAMPGGHSPMVSPSLPDVSSTASLSDSELAGFPMTDFSEVPVRGTSHPEKKSSLAAPVKESCIGSCSTHSLTDSTLANIKTQETLSQPGPVSCGASTSCPEAVTGDGQVDGFMDSSGTQANPELVETSEDCFVTEASAEVSFLSRTSACFTQNTYNLGSPLPPSHMADQSREVLAGPVCSQSCMSSSSHDGMTENPQKHTSMGRIETRGSCSAAAISDCSGFTGRREQSIREQCIREQSIKEQGIKEQGSRDQGSIEQCSREQCSREQCSREQCSREQCSREQGSNVKKSTMNEGASVKEKSEEGEEGKGSDGSDRRKEVAAWVPVTDPSTGVTVYLNSNSGHTLTQAQWTDRDMDHVLTQCSTHEQKQDQPSSLAVTTVIGELSPLSHSSLEALVKGHLATEDDGESDAGSKRIGGREEGLMEEEMRGDTVINIVNTWENPVFKKPEQVLQTASRSQAGKVARCFFPPTTFTKAMLSGAKVIGQVDKKFVACLIREDSTLWPQASTGEKHDGSDTGLVVLFDQHAAHERVRLEQLLADVYEKGEGCRDGEKRRIQRCAVDPPRIVDLTEEDVRLMHTFREEFDRIGVQFTVDEERRDRVHAHTMPACMAQREANDRKRGKDPLSYEYLRIMIKEHSQLLLSTSGARYQLPQQVHRLLATHACKGAVKFGEHLSMPTCRELLASLSSCDLPFQCAHGRPSIAPLISLSHLSMAAPCTRQLPRLWRLLHGSAEGSHRESSEDTEQKS